MTISATGTGPIVSLLTLGCKLNQADSEALAREFLTAGCRVVDRPVSADIFVINSCSVTHVADRKSRKLVRLARRLAPEATIVLTGCYVETAGPDIRAETGADLVLGNRDKSDIVRRVVSAQTDRAKHPESSLSRLQLHSGLRARAFIKIQEGCNDVCAFCIVPRTRGRELSTPIDRVVRQVQQCESEGVQEVVLTGTQLGAYGRDSEGQLSPSDVIRAVLAETSVPRIRFSSLQPQDITTELVALWDDPRLCRHFHLALQNGSESVLRRMRRRYTCGDYREALTRIRHSITDVAVTTDVIVGFPGETDSEFEDNLRFCEEAEFAGLHVFPFSRRSGTGADKMPDQIPVSVRRERTGRMLSLKVRAEQTFRSRYVGRSMAVLWEAESNGEWEGHTDNYIRVIARSSQQLRNRLTAARMLEATEQGLVSEIEFDSPSGNEGPAIDGQSYQGGKQPARTR